MAEAVLVLLGNVFSFHSTLNDHSAEQEVAGMMQRIKTTVP